MEAFKMVQVYILEAEDREEWAVIWWVKAIVEEDIRIPIQCLCLIKWEWCQCHSPGEDTSNTEVVVVEQCKIREATEPLIIKDLHLEMFHTRLAGVSTFIYNN